MHVAGDAGLDLGPLPAVAEWLDRVATQPGRINDLEPYPPHARRRTGLSVYG